MRRNFCLNICRACICRATFKCKPIMESLTPQTLSVKLLQQTLTCVRAKLQSFKFLIKKIIFFIRKMFPFSIANLFVKKVMIVFHPPIVIILRPESGSLFKKSNIHILNSPYYIAASPPFNHVSYFLYVHLDKSHTQIYLKQ